MPVVPQQDPLVIVIAVYTWPFLLTGFVGMLIYTWQQRVFDRATTEQRVMITKVRTDLEARLTRLEAVVVGDDGQNGLRSNVRRLLRKMDRILLTFTLWAEREKVVLPTFNDDDDS